ENRFGDCGPGAALFRQRVGPAGHQHPSRQLHDRPDPVGRVRGHRRRGGHHGAGLRVQAPPCAASQALTTALHSHIHRSAKRRSMAVNLIIALTVISFIGINASRIEFSLYALSLDASPSGVGGILSMLYVFPALLSWPIGALSDRFGARWLLIFGTACGALGMLVPVFWRALPALYIAATLMGITLAFIGVLSQSLIGILSSA